MSGAIARSAYLRLRSLGENQHSAAFACGLPLLPSPAVLGWWGNRAANRINTHHS